MIKSGCTGLKVSVYGDASNTSLSQLRIFGTAKTSNGRIAGLNGRMDVLKGGYAYSMTVESDGIASIRGTAESCCIYFRPFPEVRISSMGLSDTCFE